MRNYCEGRPEKRRVTGNLSFETVMAQFLLCALIAKLTNLLSMENVENIFIGSQSNSDSSSKTKNIYIYIIVKIMHDVLQSQQLSPQ